MAIKTAIAHQDHTKMARPQLLLCGLLLYTTIYYLQIGSRVSALGNIRIEFLVGIAMVVFSAISLHGNHGIDIETRRIIAPICWFIAAAIASIPTTVAGFNTINMLIFFFKSFSVFVMIMAAVKSEKGLKAYIYFLVLMMAFVLIEAKMTGNMHNSSGLLRLNAVTLLFAHPNALGGLGAACIPLLYYLFKYHKNIIAKVAILVTAAIVFIAVTMTQSRSAIVGIVAFVFYVWTMSKKKSLSAAMIFLVAVIAWTSLDDVTKERYQSISDTEAVVSGHETSETDRSIAKRYEIILDGFRLFIQRPINGFGIGGYQTARIERLGRWQVCHCAYVQTLSELGLLGFIPWMLILSRTYLLFSKTRKKILDESNIEHFRFIYQMTYAFQANLVVHFVLSLFGHSPYDNYWWIASAISLKLHYFVNKETI
ncbi:MAG: O-antigen ligase family protein [Syntrophaceae bacterium]|nr:O-antigen ligase family protein [Syntrophaceae bacterium]